MSVPMLDPGQRLSEEQDYVQAYENVREKYKGNDAPYGKVWARIWSTEREESQSCFYQLIWVYCLMAALPPSLCADVTYGLFNTAAEEQVDTLKSL
ncbi:hypothetical protein GBF38_010670 [Nibea albiflora]|uniref:Uncharacterized protein n=1 Tax=Nibea albiflora TaxID=240163 RepID=A0ACB7ET65_NIBAL|nr:hypothetical protein GBF38_010670 [Nibea albiflora]